MSECEECKPGAPGWIVTFADLMSLLLTFFVLLLSFAEMEVVKYEQAAGSLKEAFGQKSELALLNSKSGEELLPQIKPADGTGEGDASGPPTPAEVEARLKEVLEESGFAEEGTAKVTRHGVVLQLEGDLLFGSGASDLNQRARPVLKQIAEYMKKGDETIDVVGHTDNIPIETSHFPSNWELSAARAGQAVRYMVEQGVPADRLRAIGQAETVPIASNANAEGRSTNRRVEFVFTIREDVPEAALEDVEPSPTEGN